MAIYKIVDYERQLYTGLSTDAPPSNPHNGDVWYKIDNGDTLIYNDGNWVYCPYIGGATDKWDMIATGDYNPGYPVSLPGILYGGASEWRPETYTCITGPITIDPSTDLEYHYYIACHPKSGSTPSKLYYRDPATQTSAGGYQLAMHFFDADGTQKSYLQYATGSNNSLNELVTRTHAGLDSSVTNVRFCLYISGLEDSYAYLGDGRILFAGINTPYYGKTNIND